MINFNKIEKNIPRMYTEVTLKEKDFHTFDFIYS